MEIYLEPSETLISSETFPPLEEWRKSEESEEAYMINQARLARWLKKTTARRLSGRAADISDGKYWTMVVPAGIRVRRKLDGFAPVELQMHEDHLKLTDVIILPKVEEASLGTLEAHVNGFVFTASSFRMVFVHADVKRYFMKLGDMITPSLLQFHLHDPIKLGTIETKDIQFQLVPTLDDRLTGNKLVPTPDDRLKDFVHKVENPKWTCRSRLPIYFEPLNEFTFHGAFTSTRFALTRSALVILEETSETPFVVVLLCDIEIVNLALFDISNMMHMTVIFKDFKRDSLKIRKVPTCSLRGIKHRLNFGGVKYYVNSETNRDWNAVLENIRKFPKKFIESGGWGSLGLEDSLTLAHYSKSDSDSDSDSDSESDSRRYGSRQKIK